jgi:hypothetical protein
LQQFGFENGTGERRRDLAGRKAPIGSLIIVPAEPANLLSARVPGIEMRFWERPAVVREIIARLEIDGIERQAITAPMVGRAAEKAETACLHVEWQADALALVKVLRVLLEFHATAFEECHPKR